MSLSKYEHLEEVLLLEKEESCAIVPADDIFAKPTTTTWITRRRQDGKLFLAVELEDSIGLIDRVGEGLKRLLNHPNLVCLVDIARDSKVPGGGKDFLVWDKCDTNLNKLFLQMEEQRRKERL
ncbi:hypothetical protein FGG08_004555 [Glutinoglossum americanum]|uniref:Uncharacterized protein n=1 Tax=Glutinoglossum americanum TaxID=1670608 RepID=A0A9P8I910_9PEZI|nr:hypothetical protein FGG08_004555 [Glutinoglossum americanum]